MSFACVRLPRARVVRLLLVMALRPQSGAVAEVCVCDPCASSAFMHVQGAMFAVVPPLPSPTPRACTLMCIVRGVVSCGPTALLWPRPVLFPVTLPARWWHTLPPPLFTQCSSNWCHLTTSRYALVVWFLLQAVCSVVFG